MDTVVVDWEERERVIVNKDLQMERSATIRKRELKNNSKESNCLQLFTKFDINFVLLN